MTYPDTITLAKGAHKDRSDGLCLLEAVAWFAGEPHSDHPACVSPVLAAYGRSLNDALGDDSRRLLIPFISVLSRTAGDGLDEARGYLALDWIIRVYTPAWLDVAGLTREARALRDLRCISDMAAVQDARPVVLSAWDAARAAAWDAAGDAARAAAWAAAGDAAWDAAGDAAWAAAGDAAWAAAGTAARPAAWAAAGTAARDALAPTVAVLQDSAVGLYRAMIVPAAAS